MNIFLAFFPWDFYIVDYGNSIKHYKALSRPPKSTKKSWASSARKRGKSYVVQKWYAIIRNKLLFGLSNTMLSQKISWKVGEIIKVFLFFLGKRHAPMGRIYFCIRRILYTNQCLILYTNLGVKSRKKGLDHSGAGSDSSGAFLGSLWVWHLKFSAYASFVISRSLSKFELI